VEHAYARERTLLLAWIPSAFVRDVQAAIDVAAPDPLAWLSSSPSRVEEWRAITPQLETALVVGEGAEPETALVEASAVELETALVVGEGGRTRDGARRRPRPSTALAARAVRGAAVVA
jgi:hypothetical protein